jgi:SRSO17 transposase
VETLGQKLRSTFDCYRPLLRTKTQDCSDHGLTMLKGYFLLGNDRNYTKIAQKVIGYKSDGQDLQHFMSDSPWDTAGVFKQVRQDLSTKLGLSGGMLNFDECGDECSGKHKAGAARQYLGREGKVEMGQVGVLSSYYKDGVWVLTDAELFLPKSWFNSTGTLWTDEAGRLKVHKRLHIPADRVFKTKVELAQEQFDRALCEKVGFEAVGGDSFYGRSTAFRRHVDSKGCHYMFCVPKDTPVWVENPLTTTEQGGNLVQTVAQVAQQAVWGAIDVRACERGMLRYEHAFVKVWTQDEDGKGFSEEILVARRENDGKLSFALSNALDKSHHTLSNWRADRYFVERTFQDCKSELGWDEMEALKYRAYMHTLALCAIALVFMADVKMGQRMNYSPPSEVEKHLNIPKLPDLSLANVKELMKTVFPLPQLTKEEAVEKVIQILWKRSKSTESKHKKNLHKIPLAPS